MQRGRCAAGDADQPIVDVQALPPADLHVASKDRGKRESNGVPCVECTQVLVDLAAVRFRGHYHRKSSVRRIGVRQLEMWTDGSHVQRFDQQKIVRRRRAIKRDRAASRLQGTQRVAVGANRVWQFLVHWRLLGARLRLVRGDARRDQAAPGGLKEPAVDSRTADTTEIERASRRRRPALDDVGEGSADAEATRDVVGGADGEEGKRHVVPGHQPRGFGYRPITTSCHDQLGLRVQQAHGIRVPLDDAHELVPPGCQRCPEFGQSYAVTSGLVVEECDFHADLVPSAAIQFKNLAVGLQALSAVRILVSNDDGVYSPGIKALAEVAAEFGTVRIVAPDVERSAMGSAVTASRPLSYRSTNVGGFTAYRVNGTPADCVALGVYHWEQVDVVLSGLNIGLNLGHSIWHSGTVAAAKQASLLGLRGVALSAPAGAEPDFEPHKPWIRRVLAALLPDAKLPLVNVNFPRKPRGLVWTRVSVRRYDGRVVPTTDPGGHDLFWFAISPTEGAEEGTDRWAVEQGWVSLTPLRLDLTDEAELGIVRRRMPLDEATATAVSSAASSREAALSVQEDEATAAIVQNVPVKAIDAKSKSERETR